MFSDIARGNSYSTVTLDSGIPSLSRVSFILEGGGGGGGILECLSPEEDEKSSAICKILKNGAQKLCGGPFQPPSLAK